METIDEYAAEVEQSVRSAVAHAMLMLTKDRTPERDESTEVLDLLLAFVEERSGEFAEFAMEYDGLTTRTDPADGLRYVVAEGVAA